MKASAVFVVNALSQCAVLLDTPPPPEGLFMTFSKIKLIQIAVTNVFIL